MRAARAGGGQVELQRARAALAAAARRTAELLLSVGDGGRPATGLRWTVAEVGAHLAVAPRAFASAAKGETDVVTPFIPDTNRYPDRLGAVTSGTLALEPTRDPAVLAGRVTDAADEFLVTTAGRSGHEPVPTPWYGEGVTLPLAAATAILLGEQVVHGYDIARSVGRWWRVDPDDARLVAGAVPSMLRLALNREAAEVVTASYDIRVRGGPRFCVRIERGDIEVDWTAAPGVDCHISADPVAFLLVGYGRIGQWGPIATGKLLTWGRRPWLALRFRDLFHDP